MRRKRPAVQDDTAAGEDAHQCGDAEHGGRAGFCGSAPGVRFVLTSAALAIDCVAEIGSLSGSGALYTSDVARLSIAVTGETFDGPINGGASSVITCCAQGVQTLRGDSTFPGSVIVTSESLLLDGATFPIASRGRGRVRSLPDSAATGRSAARR
jgi:hypothetical protein